MLITQSLVYICGCSVIGTPLRQATRRYSQFLMTAHEFEKYITESESSTLDFKTDIYDFKNDKEKVVTSKFIKDIISFANTIRTESSFIIFGIQENDDGSVNLNGISNKIDDAMLQDKVKDKVIPRPIFSYSTLSYQGKQFGIIEFPIQKYEMPIVPSVNDLKGLEAGKVYYRNGTANTEATAYDVIRINDWLKSLPSKLESNSFNDEVSSHLKELARNNKKVSEILTDLLLLSKKYNLEDLKQFCLDELQGINSKEKDYSYRTQTVMFSWNKITINPFTYLKPTVQLIKKEMAENKDFFESKIVLRHPILEIERYLANVENELEGSYAVLETDTQALLDYEKKFSMYIYLFPYNFINLYGNIRQKAIDLLMLL